MIENRPFQKSRASNARSGLATLEFVLALPFILVVATLLVGAAYLSLGKATVTAKARHEVWSERGDLSKATNHSPLAATSLINPISGKIYGERERKVKIASYLGGQWKFRSGAALLTGSWDKKQVTGFSGVGPHFAVLGQMAFGGGLGDVQALINQVKNFASSLLSIQAPDVLGGLDGALGALSGAIDVATAALDGLNSVLGGLEDVFSGLSKVAKLLPGGKAISNQIDKVTNQIGQLSDGINSAKDYLNRIKGFFGK